MLWILLVACGEITVLEIDTAVSATSLSRGEFVSQAAELFCQKEEACGLGTFSAQCASYENSVEFCTYNPNYSDTCLEAIVTGTCEAPLAALPEQPCTKVFSCDSDSPYHHELYCEDGEMVVSVTTLGLFSGEVTVRIGNYNQPFWHQFRELHTLVPLRREESASFFERRLVPNTKVSEQEPDQSTIFPCELTEELGGHFVFWEDGSPVDCHMFGNPYEQLTNVTYYTHTSAEGEIAYDNLLDVCF